MDADTKQAGNRPGGGVAEWRPADDPSLLLACLERPEPPRPYGYGRQLREDAASWRCLALWAAGLGLVAAGLALRLWLVAACGVLVLGTYVEMLRSAVAFSRTAPVSAGLLRWVRPWSRALGLSAGMALLPDRSVVEVVVVTGAAREMLAEHGRVEVLFLHDAERKLGQVVGLRPAPASPEQSP